MIKCPYCAEEIQAEAIKCKHCGEWLKEQKIKPSDKQTEIPADQSKNPLSLKANLVYLILTIIIILLITLLIPKMFPDGIDKAKDNIQQSNIEYYNDNRQAILSTMRGAIEKKKYGLAVTLGSSYKAAKDPELLSLYNTAKTRAAEVRKKAEIEANSKAKNCYDLGYRFGMCTAKSLQGLKCKPENDIVMPETCRLEPETDKGIEAGATTVYDALNLDKGASSVKEKSTQKKESNIDVSQLTYVKSREGILKYEKVLGIPLEMKKKIFYEIVEYEDATGDPYGAMPKLAKRYNLPERAVGAIKQEGMVKTDWPMP